MKIIEAIKQNIRNLVINWICECSINILLLTVNSIELFQSLCMMFHEKIYYFQWLVLCENQWCHPNIRMVHSIFLLVVDSSAMWQQNSYDTTQYLSHIKISQMQCMQRILTKIHAFDVDWTVLWEKTEEQGISMLVSIRYWMFWKCELYSRNVSI